MKSLYQYLPKLFERNRYNEQQRALDRYVSERHPQSVAEVEHYTKEFDRRQLNQQDWRI